MKALTILFSFIVVFYAGMVLQSKYHVINGVAKVVYRWCA